MIAAEHSNHGACRGCGRVGELVRGVCRNSRLLTGKPKLMCLRAAAAKDAAAQNQLLEFVRTRPRTPVEQLILWRIRGVDKAGQGCYKPLGDLAVGRLRRGEDPEPDQPRVSLRTARRAVSALRVRKEVVFAGQTQAGTTVYLDPRQRYEAKNLPVCSTRSISHLGWTLDDAKQLCAGTLEEPQDLIIDGYKVNRRVRQEWSLPAIQAAIAVAKSWYPDLSRIEYKTALLVTILRQTAAGQNALYRARMSETAKRQDERRLKEVADSLRVDRRPNDDAEYQKGRELLAQLLGKDRAASLAPEAPAPAQPQPVKTPARPQSKPAQTDPPPDHGPTLREQIDAFLRSEESISKAQATVRMYQEKCRNLAKWLQADSVEAITFEDVRDYVAKRRESVAEATIAKELVALNVVCKHHGRDLRTCTKIDRLYRKVSPKPQRAANPLTYDNYLRLREVLEPNRRLYVDVAVYTGARLSELERMRLEDIDLLAQRMYIRGTKNEQSKRWIPIAEPLQPILEGAKASRQSGRLLEHWKNSWRDLRLACEQLAIPVVSVLDLRHTFATWLKRELQDSKAVGELMGHTTGFQVDRTYGHLDDQALRRVVEHLPKPRPKPGPDPAPASP